MKAFFRKLKATQKSDIPYLTPCGLKEQCTPFDLAVKDNKTLIVERLLQLMIAGDKQGYLYQETVDRNFDKLF